MKSWSTMKSSPNHSKQPARCDGPASASSGRARREWRVRSVRGGAELRVRFVRREADLFHEVLDGVHGVKRHLHQLPADVLPERRAAALHLTAVDLRAPVASPFCCCCCCCLDAAACSEPRLCCRYKGGVGAATLSRYCVRVSTLHMLPPSSSSDAYASLFFCTHLRGTWRRTRPSSRGAVRAARDAAVAQRSACCAPRHSCVLVRPMPRSPLEGMPPPLPPPSY